MRIQQASAFIKRKFVSPCTVFSCTRTLSAPSSTTQRNANFILMIFFIVRQLFNTSPRCCSVGNLHYDPIKQQQKEEANVCTNPFLCGLRLIGVRDVDCSTSLCWFSSATLSLVTICSSIWIFSILASFVLPLVFLLALFVAISASTVQSEFVVFVQLSLFQGINAQGCNFKYKHH